MRPSTTTGVALRSFGNPLLNDYEETVRRLYDAGYRVLDFAFVCHNYPNYILRFDDWQQRIDRIANLAQKLGVTFSQSHLPYITDTIYCADANFQKPGYAEYFDECMRRAYIGSAMLGVRYATAHPMSFPEYNFEELPQQEENRKYYDKFVELGISHGVGTAFENMLPSLNRSWPDRYCTRYEELIRLVDSYNDPMVGICWDTGHANQMRFDQVRALRAVGHRLKNTHINDNHYGTRDEHLQPFMGTIDWFKLIPVLAEIGYDGDLAYETNQVGIKAKGELQDAILRLTYENGCYLVKIYEDALAQRDQQNTII